jgi:predicted dehydrogenase
MNRILIIGYGSIGKRHVRNILKFTNSQIIIYTKRSDLDFKTNRVIITDSLDYCLSQKPNIGFICNETSYHIPIALKLAKAGLDLFLEKPLSDSIKGVKQLEKIVKQKKIITQMGHHMRFHDCIIKIRKLIKQNKVGRIISIQVENGSYLPDWHPNEDYTKSYAGKKGMGGGIILTQIHDIDYLYWFFGNPKSIFSFSGKLSDLKISSEDYSSSIIQFPNRITAELHLDFFQGPEYRGCKIKGTNGIITWNSIDNKIKFFNNRNKKWEIILNITNYERNQLYVDEIKHFLKCVKNRKKTINPLADGIKTLNIALTMKKSSRTNKLIELK